MALAKQDVSDWVVPPPDLALHPDEVHAWRVALNAEQDVVDRLAVHLSGAERQRADARSSEDGRRRFVVSHGARRKILSRYLATEASVISFSEPEGRKPCLVGVPTDPSVSFNLSHSDDLALLAVTQERAVGIDVERVRPAPLKAEIADRYFSPKERAQWYGLPEEELLEAFFLGWTRKEAYSKALGIGVCGLWTRFHVSLAQGDPVELADDRWEEAGAPRYELRALAAGAGFVAAVAAQGSGWVLKCYHWSPDCHD